MNSKIILILHTTGFIFLTVVSFTFPFIAFAYPEFMTLELLAVFLAVALLVPLSWLIAGGCPLTVWENRLRESEKPGSSYRESCTQKYLLEWFNVRIPRWLSIVFILVRLAIPVAATAWVLFFV